MENVEKNKNKDFLEKLQNLPLGTKKTILFSVALVVLILLGFLFVQQTKKGLENFERIERPGEYGGFSIFPFWEEDSQLEVPAMEEDSTLQELEDLQRKFEENPEEFQELMKKIQENPEEAEKALEEFERAIQEKTMTDDDDDNQL